MSFLFVVLLVQQLGFFTSEANTARMPASGNHIVLPWTLAYAERMRPRATPFREISIDFTMVAGDLSKSSNLFVVPLSCDINNTHCYFGAIGNIPAVDVTGGRLRYIGPGAMFTKFGEKCEDAVSPGVLAYRFLSDHEGDHASLRKPLKFGPGHYTFTIQRADPIPQVGQKLLPWQANYTQVMVHVIGHQTNPKQMYILGWARFPGRELKLGRSICSFVEVSRAEENKMPTDIPTVYAAVSNFRIDGKLADIDTIAAIYPRRVPSHTLVAPTSILKNSDDPRLVKFPQDKRDIIFLTTSWTDPVSRAGTAARLYPYSATAPEWKR